MTAGTQRERMLHVLHTYRRLQLTQEDLLHASGQRLRAKCTPQYFVKCFYFRFLKLRPNTNFEVFTAITLHDSHSSVGSTSSNVSSEKTFELISASSTATVYFSDHWHAYTCSTRHRPHTSTLNIEAACSLLMFISTSIPTLRIPCKKILKISQCITTDRPSCSSD
jgi:hypothetical protein